MKVDHDTITNRWSISLPDEPGRPRIEADTPEQLEDFLTWIEEGQHLKRHKQLAQAGA